MLKKDWYAAYGGRALGGRYTGLSRFSAARTSCLVDDADQEVQEKRTEHTVLGRATAEALQ